MAAYTQYYATAVPIPSKGDQYAAYYMTGGAGSTYSVSPPEDLHDASVTSGVPSYGSHSSYSVGPDSSYYGDDGSAASGVGYDSWDGASAASASGVDFNDYIHGRFADSFDPIPLDRSLAVQAQT
jgi:biogenesis of lysosome-related organelles complex 1 subunit KXD1